MLILLICYQMAIRKTVAAWRVNLDLKKERSQTTDISTSTTYLLRKHKNLEAIVHRYTEDSTTFRSDIISRVALIASKNNISVNSVPGAAANLQTPELGVEKLELQGRFFPLLTTLQAIEHGEHIGTVRSLKISKTRPSASPTDEMLHMEVFLEVIKIKR